MTQKDRTHTLLCLLLEGVSKDRLTAPQTILDDDGAADGSLSPGLWLALQGAVHVLRGLRALADNFQEVEKRPCPTCGRPGHLPQDHGGWTPDD